MYSFRGSNSTIFIFASSDGVPTHFTVCYDPFTGFPCKNGLKKISLICTRCISTAPAETITHIKLLKVLLSILGLYVL